MVIPSVGQADEDEIINSLLCFEQFKDFYREKYEPIKGRIVIEWMIYPELSKRGLYAMYGVDKDTGIDQIFLQRPPTTVADAYLVAHEMGHAIKKARESSLRIIEKDPDYIDIAGCIKSVIEDRPIDIMLKKYGFNLVDHHYAEAMALANNKFDELDAEPTGIERSRLILVHADFLLRFDLIDKDASFKRKFNRYKKNARKFRPIAKEGKKIAKEAQRIGFDTQDQQRQIFGYITNELKLTEVLCISE